MSLRKRIWHSLFITTLVTPMLPSFFVSCQSQKIGNVDGSDWKGVISGHFKRENYEIDEFHRTITYYGDPAKGGADIQFKDLVIPNYVSYNKKIYCVLLGDYCFQSSSTNGPTGVGSVEFNDFIDEIPVQCFQNQIQITSLKFHIYPKIIGDSAFINCHIHKIYVNNSDHWAIKLKYVGTNAFNEARLEGSLIFGEDLEFIGDRAFYNNFNLQFIDLSFSTKITRIPTEAFSLIISLREVNVHKGLTTFGNGCFLGCTLLQVINLPVEGMQLTIEPNAFFNCTGFLRFSKKFKLNSVGAYAFTEDIYLEERFWEPEYGLEVIPEGAFDGISSATIVLSPGAPREIQNSAFADCKQLTTIDLTNFVWPNYPKWTGVNIFVNAGSIIEEEKDNGFILFDKSQLDENGEPRQWIKDLFYDSVLQKWTKQGIEISDKKWIFEFVEK